jgi:hypothetical protein
VSFATRLLSSNPGAQVSDALTGSLVTRGAKGPWSEGAMEYIASSTPSGTNTITFSSIPSTYKHLQIHAHSCTGRTTNTTDGAYVRYNSDSGSNYQYSYVNASVASHNSGSQGSPTGYNYLFFHGTQQNNDGFSATILTILNYASTSVYKTGVWNGGSTNDGSYGEIGMGGGVWRSTSAINSITIYTETGSNYIAGTRFDLYGIKES